MNRIDFAWPEGREGALTTSWDDGTEFDRQLVEIFNQNGIKGTFNLNSGKLGSVRTENGWNNYIRADEVKSLYSGHEVAVHTVSHPWLQRQADDMILSEVIEDRANLEKLVGYPVRGMALPFGSQDARVGAILKAAGIVYVRPVQQSGYRFDLPGDFMNWTVTCHHKADLPALWQEFMASKRNTDKLFYLWGHSYEFNNDDNWQAIEAFSQLAGQASNIWHATNIEIYDYVTAWRNLRCSVDVSSLQNITATRVWFLHQGRLQSIAPGETVNI